MKALTPFLASSTAAALLLMAGAAHANDWGAYSIVPVSGPALVLEVVDAGNAEGAVVSINKPAGAAHQKWLITPKENNLYAIQPAHAPTLVLAVAKGGVKNGTAMVLEKDSGQPWQRWSLVKQQDNDSYSLLPQHVQGMGLDHFGGKQEPGARIDLWSYKATDQHLQWFIKPLAGTGVAKATEEAKPTYEPPVIKPEVIKPGEIKQLQFTQSQVFPGTVRDVTVFIPAQYNAAKPACVYVKTDGFNPREKELMETMIATGEMPVTVGVFVRPGTLPAPMKGTLDRRNRCFEYDGVSDNNVRFFTEELLPFVAKECNLNLSTDGNDRCVSGGSSGGIAAFTAAWHRPEAFSRVYAASGSWVAFRGGHEFPMMVRKFEAKPIRAFLTTATHDMENAAGDWYLLDQEMDKALKFSGYDYQFRIIDGKHVAGYIENYREGMAYLWKGWPERVKAGPSAPRAQEVIIPGEGWKLVAEGFKDARGPSCNSIGEVFFIDEDRIRRIELDGKVTMFAASAYESGSLTVGADDTLYAGSRSQKAIVSFGSSQRRGNVIDVMVAPVAKGLDPEFILAMPNGGFYVASNGTIILGGQNKVRMGPGTVTFAKDGKTEMVIPSISNAAALAYRPDQWLLSIANAHSKWVHSYQIAEDGKLINGEKFFHLYVADWDDDAGAEGLCYSLEGRQFVATRSGVQISADDGPTQVILPVPDGSAVTGVCLGGKDKDLLFAFCGKKIWQRKIQHHAMGAFTPWTKVTGTKL